MASVLERGERVHLRSPRLRDRDAFLAAVRASRSLHRPWVYPPEDAEAFASYLRRVRSPDAVGFVVRRNEDDAITGVINLSQIFLGNFRSAFLGYYALEPFAGRGYMTEGMRLALHHAFGVLGLHRLEANVQPANASSVALVRRLGFRREGFSPRYLKVGGRWRDHERWAILAEDFFAAETDRRSGS